MIKEQSLPRVAEKLEQCVFKGGTSLSKGFHVIDRFSEDIDITFNEHIGESRRKKLKNVVLKGISEELGLPIANWNDTQSDRDYNAYLFSYSSVFGLEDDRLPQYVKLETALQLWVVTCLCVMGLYLQSPFQRRNITLRREKPYWRRSGNAPTWYWCHPIMVCMNSVLQHL